MIRLPSLSKPSHAFVSFDDAIVQPPQPPADSADEEALAAYKKAAEEHYAKIRAARQTGDWAPVTIEGKHPLRFLMRPMPFDGYAVIQGMLERGENREDILLLAMQLCLLEIDGAAVEVKKEKHPRFGEIASLSFLDKFGTAQGLRIAVELGAIAIQRAGADPS